MNLAVTPPLQPRKACVAVSGHRTSDEAKGGQLAMEVKPGQREGDQSTISSSEQRVSLAQDVHT